MAWDTPIGAVGDPFYGLSVSFLQWVITAFIAMILFIFIVWEVYNRIKYNPEAADFIKGRRKELPILNVHDLGSGRSHISVGEKDEKGAPVFTDEVMGIKIDPAFIGHSYPERHSRGLEIYHYPSTGPLPLSIQSVCAINTCVKKSRELRPGLTYLTDLELTTLLKTPRDVLDHDAAIYVEKYMPDLNPDLAATLTQDEITWARSQNPPVPLDHVVAAKKEYRKEKILPYISSLVKDVVFLQDELGKTPIDYTLSAYNQAFKNNPYSLTSQSIHSIMLWVKRMEQLRNQKFLNMVQYGMVIMGILLAGGIAFYIVTIKH